ncbi:MAG: SDR family oxidoreductase [Gemmatimonadales bacterium]
MLQASTVLVTGGSGFLGSHTIARLLAAGHRVRTTVRSLAREPQVRTMLATAGADPGDRLQFFAADLERDAGWPKAVTGCDYVLHVASPFPVGAPKHEDDLIVPAREGTLRVLRAARGAGVRRVVLTSSFAAIGYGHPPQAGPFDESSWTDPHADVSAYVRSKTLAEQAAWQFVAGAGQGLELSVVNPVAIFGPVLGGNYASSIVLLKRLLDGSLPACPRLWFGVVDVRDVADLHLRAMTAPEANGERFLAVAGDFLRIVEMARILSQRLGPAARRVPTREPPDVVVRIAAWFVPSVRPMVTEVGKPKNATSAKAQRVLGWAPRSSEEALVAAAESLRRFGLLKGDRAGG